MSRSILVAALCCGIARAAGTPPAWNTPVPPQRIIGNTWYVGTEGISVLLLRGDAGAVLIDAALPQSVAHIRASLATLSVDPREIKLILTSHAHVDHVGGLAELKRLTGARVLATADSARQLAAGGLGDLHFGDSLPFPGVVVDDTVSDGETVTLGNLALTAHATPGHTPGSTSWSWLEPHEGGEVAVVYADSITAPGYRLLDHPQRPGLAEEFHATFARLRQLRCDVLVTPHPEASDLFGRLQRGALVAPRGCADYADGAQRKLELQMQEQRSTATEVSGS